MLSIWETDSFYFPTDILIIGAGLTGLNTAIEIKLRNPRLSIRVVERGLFPCGASVKNAGFACFGSLSEILDDTKQIGEQKALERVQTRYLGIQKLLTRVSPSDIDFHKDDGYEIFTEREANLLKDCKDAILDINVKLSPLLGFEPYEFTSNTFGFDTTYPLLKIKGEGALHSGKLVTQLLQKATSLGVIFNFGFDTKHINSRGTLWCVSNGSKEFSAHKVIVATNGFSKRLIPEEDINPARGQLLLTESIPGLKLKGTFHAHEGYFYFRALGDKILLGGGRNVDRENESTDSQEVSGVIQSAVEELLYKVIMPGKALRIERRWAGTMAFGSNNEKDPIIKELDTNLFVVARLGGMGVAMTPMLAEKIANMVLK
ncbi:NAD(P)/FAD-dependent oxidoreductase [Owenweeksia hongkongensis]|uniref:NAD(P)/FAD-dependent oxidoreductase n=1 Tax=Owenweeksia hongkongensis TaxID=253245 RepID=UPI003A8C8979